MDMTTIDTSRFTAADAAARGLRRQSAAPTFAEMLARPDADAARPPLPPYGAVDDHLIDQLLAAGVSASRPTADERAAGLERLRRAQRRLRVRGVDAARD